MEGWVVDWVKVGEDVGLVQGGVVGFGVRVQLT